MKIFKELFNRFTVFISVFVFALFVAAQGSAVYAASIAVLKDGNVSDSNVALAKQQLQTYVPESIQTYMNSKGWKVYITNENMDQKYFFGAYGHVTGVAVAHSSDRGNFLGVENTASAAKNVVVHELGHAVDYELGYASKTSTFTNLYNQEKGKFRGTALLDPSHAVSNPQEYFAAAFDEYFRNPGNLKARTPGTYNYISTCVNKIAGSAATANTAVKGWQKDAKGWWYATGNGGYLKNTWFKDGNYWYYFNSSGYMATGWIQLGGVWYYLQQSGAMATGWVNDRGTWYFMDGSGAMKTGWIYTGNKWYYLNGSGAMQTGWLNYGGARYYLGSDGTMVTGRQNINGKWYNFNSSGALIN